MLELRNELEPSVSDTAYQLWLSAGCPDGLSEKFWELAREISTGPDDLVEAGMTIIDSKSSECCSETN